LVATIVDLPLVRRKATADSLRDDNQKGAADSKPIATALVLLYWKKWSCERGRTEVQDRGRRSGLNAEDPGRVAPGSSAVWFSVGLGDSLEATDLQTKRVGLEDGNASTNDLGNEVRTVACNPDVACLVDREGASGGQEGRVLLVPGGR
jgi:hypothetical protein